MPRNQVAASQLVPEPSTRQQVVWGMQSAVILAVVWLALTGLDALLLGAVTALAGGFIGARFVPGFPYPWRPLLLLGFLAYFLRTSILGGLDVAWRAMTPRPAIEPGWITYQLTLPPGQPRTLLISILSLVPGTLSADIEADDTLIVHALVHEPDRNHAAIADLEARISELFSLGGGPD